MMICDVCQSEQKVKHHSIIIDVKRINIDLCPQCFEFCTMETMVVGIRAMNETRVKITMETSP